MKNPITNSETTDLIELLRNGPVGHQFVPEQERNFDAGHTPSTTQHRYIREEWIDGKKYNVYS